VVTAVCCW